MVDRPIIFRAPMVKALLDGRKSQIRRLAALPPKKIGGRLMTGCVSPWTRVKPGDRLWVRETFTIGFNYDEHDKPIGDEPKPFYAATFGGRWYETDTDSWRDSPLWRPSIHMPRWASRLTLIVTATKIERLQEISEEDARSEGLQAINASAREHFKGLWSDLHGEWSWLDDPEVVVLTFRVVRANVDHGEEAA